MKLTLKQIAEETGFSLSTVSRVVTGKGYVSEDARTAIEAALQRLDYVHPEHAKRELGKNKEIVMILVGGIKSSLAAATVEAVSKELNQKGIYPFVAITHFDASAELAYLRFAAENRFFGIIALTLTETPEVLAYLRTFPCPITMVDRYLLSLEMDYLRPDYYRMGYDATEYLVRNGHRDIAFVGGKQSSPITQDKQLGYEDCMRAYGLRVEEQRILHCDRLIYANGYAVARRLLDGGKMPTGIVSSNDISVSILNELFANGLRVPEDVSIVSCEDSDISAHCRVPLTAMSIDMNRISADAVKTLINRRRNPKTPHKLLIYDSELIVRKSVARINSSEN